MEGTGDIQPKGQLAGRAHSFSKFVNTFVHRQRQQCRAMHDIKKTCFFPQTVLQALGEGRKQQSSWCPQQTESLPLLSLHSTRCFPRAPTLKYQLPSASLGWSARCAKQKQVHGHTRPCQHVWPMAPESGCKYKICFAASARLH